MPGSFARGRFLWPVFRILFVHRPEEGVVIDVTADPVEVVLAADNVFVIIPLPNGDTGSFADSRLERSDDHRQTPGMPGAYGGAAQHDYAVHMVRHYHERIQRHLREVLRNLAPAILYGHTYGTASNLLIEYSSKYASPISGADRNKVRAVL